MPFLRTVLRPFKVVKSSYGGHPFRLVLATMKGLFFGHMLMEFGYTFSMPHGASMVPTFEVAGDTLLISSLHRRGRDIEVGDCISFDSVVVPGQRVIKRVLGLQGDYVMKDTPGSGSDLMIQVPEGHVWVVGDNMEWSRDSRLFGPVPMGLIKGKVIAKVLPWSERRWMVNDLKPTDPL